MPLTKDEIANRIKAFRNSLQKEGLEAALVFSPLHIFYFSGTFVRGVLLVLPTEIKLLVNRPWERAKKESLVPCEPLKSLKELPSYIKGFKKLGLEISHFNVETYERYRKLFCDFELKSIDHLIYQLRMIKSPYEISCIIEAGKKLDKALKKGLPELKPGIREIKAAAILEKELRLTGHPGFTRSLHGFELTFGYVISGKEGITPTHFVTGEGGPGVPGFPGGASFKKLKVSEPILLDFSGYHEGYYIDQTRMASFKPISQAEDFYKTSLEIIEHLEKNVKPGILSGEVFEDALSIAEKRGVVDYFMSHGEQLKFVGHGVGLQIDEPPYLALNKKEVIKENMVIALEPKFHVPELGVIGIEDTFLVTKEGLRKLTVTSRKWILLKRNKGN